MHHRRGKTRPQELAVGSDGNLYRAGVSVALFTRAYKPLSATSRTGITFAPAFPFTGTSLDSSVQVVAVSRIYLSGTNNNVKRGDTLLFVGVLGTTPATVLTAVRVVQAVAVDTQNKQTILDLSVPASTVINFLPTEIEVDAGSCIPA